MEQQVEADEKPTLPEEELQTAREARHNLRSLVAHPGWALLANVVKAQIDSRRHDSLQAMTTIEGAMERNVALSEANGMDFVMKLPEFTIESLTFDIEQLKGELNEEEKDVDN